MSFWKTYTILSPKPQLFLILYGKSTPATDSNWRAPGLWLVLAANTAHVLRLNKADVLALNKAHVLRLNTKICPVFTANTKEAAFSRLHKGVVGLRPLPPLWFPLCWL